MMTQMSNDIMLYIALANMCNVSQTKKDCYVDGTNCIVKHAPESRMSGNQNLLTYNEV